MTEYALSSSLHGYVQYLRESGESHIQNNIRDDREQQKACKKLEEHLRNIEAATHKYPKVRYFLDELLAAKKADDDGLYFSAIRELITSIAGDIILDAGSLYAFMINFFYDDAYFSIYFTEDLYSAKWAGYEEDAIWHDDPKLLVMAAKHNANHQWELNNHPFQ